MTPVSVLVVEDDRIIARGIEKRLRALGYAVAGSAGTGEEAVRLAPEVRPDLVLMDISLGVGIDGVEAAARMRRAFDAPVVFLTAYADDATLARAKVAGPYGYILKPFEDKDLQTAIELAVYKHGADRRLRESQEWLSATLGSIGDGVIATDRAHRVRFLNPVAEQLTGWTREGAAERDVREVFRVVSERTREPVPDPAVEAADSGAPALLAAGSALIDRLGVGRPIDGSAAPIRSAGGATDGAALVFRDVSDRRRLEEHLRQAQKMESLGRLAGGIAHDFNNIMTVIKGFSEMLVAGGQSEAERLEAARHIQEAADRAAGLTRQILAFSRKQTLQPVLLRVDAAVGNALTLIRRLLGPDVLVSAEGVREAGHVLADPTQFDQVLINLAANARDAMPGGGTLTVSTAVANATETWAGGDPEVRPGRYAVVAVADTGTGIPPEALPHIFEPFFTTKEVGEGTGLGLSTVHGIVRQSGGHVRVESRPGAGTTFRVYLPLADAPPPLAPAPPRPEPTGRETVLVAEDEAAIRKLVLAVLRNAGYRVLEAVDGLDALAVAQGHAGPIDLLLTDIMMPRLSGRELAERLAAERPGLRVLYMSGYAEDAPERQGPDAAGKGFLAKPFALVVLKDRVRAALDAPARPA